MSERIRVMMIVDRLDDTLGGGEMTVVSLASSLPAERYEVWVCTTRIAEGWPLETLKREGIKHVHLARSGRSLMPFRELRRVLRDERIDIVHGHMFGSNVWAALLGRMARVPVVIAQEQTWSYEGRPLRKLTDAVIGRLVHAFIAVSTADAQRMHKLERIPLRKIHMIPNAWYPREVEAEAGLRAEIGVGPDAPIITSVAVLRPQKRLEILLEAFESVAARVPDAHLVLVGSGPEDERLERIVASMTAGERVHMVGQRSDVAAIWRVVDIAAMSSDFEGTPLSALEAMSAGVPLVATSVGGIPDIAQDGVSALLVPRRDPAALAAALERLLLDPDLRRRMGEAARERAQEFTAERHAARNAELYERLLAS